MANGVNPGAPEDATQPAHDFIVGQLSDTAEHLRDVANAALQEPDDYVVITGFLDSRGQGCLVLQDLTGRDRMLALLALKIWVEARLAEIKN